jgi:hypothetical protein
VQSTANRQFKSARPRPILFFRLQLFNEPVTYWADPRCTPNCARRVSGERRRKALRGEPCKARPIGSSNLPVPTNLIFCSFKEDLKRCFISRAKTYPIRRAVQKHRFQQLTAFRRIPRNIKKISLIREFKYPCSGWNHDRGRLCRSP